MPPSKYFYSSAVPETSLVLALCFGLAACATGRAYFGHDATDLGELQEGMQRTATEKVTGKPERIEPGEQGYTAYYVFDRGYTGQIETQHKATKILYAPIMAWGELLTLGMLGLSMEHCQEVCQKGLLTVQYDSADRLVAADSAALPVTHPLLDGCLYNAAGSMTSVCTAIRNMARPPTLSSPEDEPSQR